MKRSSGAASSNGTRFFGPRASRPLMFMMRARRPRSAEPRGWTTASDKDRIRDRPGDLRLLADRAPPDRRTRRFLQHHGGAVVGLKHVAAAFAGEHRLGHRHAEAVLRRARR